MSSTSLPEPPEECRSDSTEPGSAPSPLARSTPGGGPDAVRGRAVSNPVVIGDCELWLGDCLEIFSCLGVMDALVTDPPYGIGESNERALSRGKLAAPKDYGAFDWDKKRVTDRDLALLRGTCGHQIIFGGNYYELPPTSCWLIWDKQNGDNDFADCELAWTNLKQAVRRVYWRWNGMIRKGGEERFHPTQKPVGVMEWCLAQLPADIATVFDPFMGSGTTGVACVKRGLRFVGVEREPTYFAIACKRIEDAYRQGDMFREPPPKPEQLELPGAKS